MKTSPSPTRIEHDLLGERQVPADAYYGIHTLRAIENFPISGATIQTMPSMVKALACVKQACALANHDLGVLDAERTGAIVQACQDLRRGHYHDQFVVDVIQGGAGTSTNMNANEVIPAFRIKLSLSSSPKESHVREAQVPVNRVVDRPA